MRRSTSSLVPLLLIATAVLSSCSNSKNALISSQIREINKQNGTIAELREANKELREEVRNLERQLAEAQPLPAEATTAATSQLDALRNAGLSGASAFIRGGVERTLDVTTDQIEQAIAHAQSFLGTPHVTGGNSRRGIDCSGLINVALTHAGVIGVPRTANDIGRYGTIIVEEGDLVRGDLVFFTKTYSTSRFITHVGIHLGDGEFIHTSSSKGVMISRLDDAYWSRYYAFGTRIVSGR